MFNRKQWCMCFFSVESGHFSPRPKNCEKSRSNLPDQKRGCYCHGWPDGIIACHLHIPLYLGYLWSVFFAIHRAIGETTRRLPSHLRRFPWSLLLAPAKHSRGNLIVVFCYSYAFTRKSYFRGVCLFYEWFLLSLFFWRWGGGDEIMQLHQYIAASKRNVKVGGWDWTWLPALNLPFCHWSNRL